jgi:hypothetical protein
MLDLSQQGRAMRVGNVAGWTLAFYDKGPSLESAPAAPLPALALPKIGETSDPLVLSQEDLYASIDVALPGDVSGGRFSATLESTPDLHYRKIRKAKMVEVYLYWKDTLPGVGGYFAGLAGLGGALPLDQLAPALVGRFAIRSVRRTLSTRGGVVTIEGRDWAFDALSRGRPPAQCFESLDALLKAASAEAGCRIVSEPSADGVLGALARGGGDLAEVDRYNAAHPDQSCADLVNYLAEHAGHDLEKGAPSVALLRDGAAHVGLRAIPFPAGLDKIALDAPGGLVEATLEAEEGGAATKPQGTKPARVWRLLARGRGDIKPGMVVSFKAPVDDADLSVGAGTALLGALAGVAEAFGAPEKPDTDIYVTNVTHKLGRTRAFQSEIGGVQLPGSPPLDPWNIWRRPADKDRDTATPTPPGGDAATRAALQMRDIARAASRLNRPPEVAEVRAATTSAPTATAEPAAQTVTVFAGTEGPATQNNGGRTQAIRRGARAVEARGVGVVTPFAWGACGLSAPRYPGMRVLLNYRGGQSADPLEVGALWGPETRMATQAGDWWLCLPTGAATAALGGPEATATAPGPDHPATHDLIDKDGVRVIEVGKLTLRVGQPATGSFKAGQRPQPDAATIAITHANGKAEITIDDGGHIVIKGASVTLQAGGTTLEVTPTKVEVT